MSTATFDRNVINPREGQPKSFLAVLLLSLTLLGFAIATNGHCAEKGNIVGTASPMMAIFNLSRGNEVTIMLRVVGQTERFYCPAFEIYWGDGSVTSRESDCPPFEEREEYPMRYSFKHQYRSPGDFFPEVTVRKAGKVIKRFKLETNLSFGN